MMNDAAVCSPAQDPPKRDRLPAEEGISALPQHQYWAQ